MNNLPYVSIIVAVFNGENVIDDCIQSLLAQDYPKDKYEIIVVDNNSKDKTAEVIKKYLVRYVLEDKIQGPSAARNAGVAVAKGEFLAFFDADQVAEKDWVKKILEGGQEKKYGAFVGLNVSVNSKDSLLGEYWIREWALKKDKDTYLNHFPGGNVAIRRNVFMELNGFDIYMPTCEDMDIAWRLQKNLKLSIKYNHSSIAYHKERQDVKSLLKREFGLGYGLYLLGKKHAETKKSFLILVFRTISRTILGVIALIFGFFKPLAKEKGRKLHLQLILLDIAMRWSNCLGMCYSLFNTNFRKIKHV